MNTSPEVTSREAFAVACDKNNSELRAREQLNTAVQKLVHGYLCEHPTADLRALAEALSYIAGTLYQAHNNITHPSNWAFPEPQAAAVQNSVMR
jgi:hypothetical protein